MIADEMVLIGRGKIVAQGTKAELLHTAGTYVKPEDPAALHKALAAAGIEATPSGDGGFRSEAEPIEVGRAAAAAGVVLIELRRAEGAGLEEMFLQLTSDDAREQRHPAKECSHEHRPCPRTERTARHARHLDDHARCRCCAWSRSRCARCSTRGRDSG